MTINDINPLKLVLVHSESFDWVVNPKKLSLYILAYEIDYQDTVWYDKLKYKHFPVVTTLNKTGKNWESWNKVQGSKNIKDTFTIMNKLITATKQNSVTIKLNDLNMDECNLIGNYNIVLDQYPELAI